MLYDNSDVSREKEVPANSEDSYRSPFSRDLSRLIHSPAFRRLQGKTQLFPSNESDFFRNRLTHSIEVSKIAISIAKIINKKYDFFKENPIDHDLVEFAGLAHDLGHPPFGHVGEKALDFCMRKYGGFEGNAQTLRILARLEKKEIPEDYNFFDPTETRALDKRCGLNLTYRSLASILKYPQPIAEVRITSEDDKLKAHNDVPKGFYFSDTLLVKKIKLNCGFDEQIHGQKVIECSIMDLADDIAYCTYDLEDSLKAGFQSLLDILSLDSQKVSYIREKMLERDGIDTTDSEIDAIFTEMLKDFIHPSETTQDEEVREVLQTHKDIVAFAKKYSDDVMTDGYYRIAFTSEIVKDFVNSVSIENPSSLTRFSKVTLDLPKLKKLKAIKYLNYATQIYSNRVVITALRGEEIVKDIFDKIIDNPEILPNDFKKLYDKAPDCFKPRIVCDFVSGMTDRYCIEFYGRLYSEDPQTIFKPY